MGLSCRCCKKPKCICKACPNTETPETCSDWVINKDTGEGSCAKSPYRIIRVGPVGNELEDRSRLTVKNIPPTTDLTKRILSHPIQAKFALYPEIEEIDPYEPIPCGDTECGQAIGPNGVLEIPLICKDGKCEADRPESMEPECEAGEHQTCEDLYGVPAVSYTHLTLPTTPYV